MKAWELLSSPEKWTKGEEARDSDGMPCLSEFSKACSWCILGALRKCYRSMLVELDITRRIKLEVGMSVPVWNDAPERTHAEVLEILKRLDV